jgi:hypothetical protein
MLCRGVHIVNIKFPFIRNLPQFRPARLPGSAGFLPFAALELLMHGDRAHPAQDDPRQHEGKEHPEVIHSEPPAKTALKVSYVEHFIAIKEIFLRFISCDAIIVS